MPFITGIISPENAVKPAEKPRKSMGGYGGLEKMPIFALRFDHETSE